MLTVTRTLRAHRGRLLALANVRYLAIGPKVKRGSRHPGLSIRVFVVAKHDVPRRHKVPARLRAVGPGGRTQPYYVRTDVAEAPPLRALPPQGNGGIDLAAAQPVRALTLRGGDRIEGRRRGTAALVYRSPGGRDLLLTNSHVVARPDAWAIGEAVERPAGAASTVIGRVHRMIRIRRDGANRWDAALVRVDVPADRLVVGDPPLRVLGHGRLRPGVDQRFFYVSDDTRVTCGHPDAVETPVDIDHGGGVTVSYTGFALLEVFAGAPVPTHSGSLLLAETDDGVLACGLVFAGSPQHVAVHRLRETLTALSSAAASEEDEEENVRIVF